MKLVFAFFLLASVVVCYSEERYPVFVTYTVWVGDDRPNKIDTILLITKKNATLYDVMKQAAYKDPKFEFESKEYFGKHYITTIGGLAEDTETDHYWMVYNLKFYPNPFKPPKNSQLSPVGVDDIFAKNFDNYLLWYKHVDFGEHY